MVRLVPCRTYKNIKIYTLIYICIYIYKAVVKAGAAAEHAEARKDDCHEARVMAVGGEFYPVVVETSSICPDLQQRWANVSLMSDVLRCRCLQWLGHVA